MIDASKSPPLAHGGRGVLDELRVRRRLLQFAGSLTTTLARLRLELALASDDTAREAIRVATKARTSKRLLHIFGLQVSGDGPLPPSTRARLIVANHRTAFDIGVMMSLFGGVMLSRGDLASWPVIGPLSREGRTIFVDRESGHSGARAIRAIRRALDAGETVVVYPEGTTYIGDEVRPFLPGAFAAARGLPVDIVPVGLAYDAGVEYFETPFVTHLEQVAARPRTHVVVRVGEPFPAEGKTTELALRAQRAVQALVDEARVSHRAAGGRV
ncbi:MAG: 1-acyl-sn-glycerol-3-phosphate acyltransferase [Myxococcales bacterium]|nr:1-acyl-sn-glycerol-3-phosphate acyltransferase [Myxococcales bacterium]MCB9629224.1 1-acyl-sn-glycerol-3-phosphate acyltransferase [Sandaracinaceae bacterium]